MTPRHLAMVASARSRSWAIAARSVADRRPAPERETGEQAGNPLAGCSTGLRVSVSDAPLTSALRGARVLQRRTK